MKEETFKKSFIKRSFSLFFIFVLLFNIVSFVDAERFVNYNLKAGRIDENGNFFPTENLVNNVNIIGFTCLDQNCENLGERIFNNQVLSSGENSFIQLFYPTNLLSNFGYAVYYYKDGFISWESNPNWWGVNPSDPQGPYNVYLSKKEFCSSEIESFSITNAERPNTPVVFNVEAKLDAATKAAINEAGPLKAVPSELKEHYSVKTLVKLSIVDEFDTTVYFDEQELTIGFGENGNAEFRVIPQGVGNFKAIVTTKVSDEKCLSSRDNFVEKEFVVLEEVPESMCYTSLNNLELSSHELNAGDDLILSFNKLSNIQLDKDNDVVEPINTDVKVSLVRSDIQDIVFEQTFNLDKNENSVDIKKVDLFVNIPDFLETGAYDLNIKGFGNDERCGFDNEGFNLSDRIFIESNDDDNNNFSPEIISEPIREAILGETYFYDVDAVDPDNDELTYILLLGPQGMNIDSNSGLINWFVDPFVFSRGENKLVVVLVTDGFFIDMQFFFVTIDKEIIKEETKKHDFRFSGLNLETSNVENGIRGFLLLKNGGDFKENKVSVTADIYELDVHEVLTSNINLGKQDSFWIPIDVQVPSNTKSGEYLLNIKISNNKHTEEQSVVVFIENNNQDKIKVITR